MRTPVLLFLQSCGSCAARLGASRRNLCSQGAVLGFFPQRHLHKAAQRSFLPLHFHLGSTSLSREFCSSPITMAKKKVQEEDQPIDTEAMLLKGKMILERLEEVYPKAPEGFLDHNDAFTLLIAVVLSAQSLDIKVNEITPELFKQGGTPEDMRALGETRIREIIRQIGLAPQKAKNIAKLSDMICEKFDGNVPNTFEGLESLPGVGHKTASVVMMQAFKKPAFPVDTHIHRLACRWGCGEAKSVEKTEAALKLWFPDPNSWGNLHTRIILFGREYCPARKHDMDLCPICSFAATDEARTMNRQNPTKFVAPKTHKSPFSIRDVPKIDLADGDADFVPKQASPAPRKRKADAKKRSTVVKDNTETTAKRTSRRTRKGVASAEELNEKIADEAPAKRPRRKGKLKVSDAEKASPSNDEMMEVTAETQVVVTQRVGRRKKQAIVSKAEEIVQANGEAPRRSSRVRVKSKKELDSSS